MDGALVWMDLEMTGLDPTTDAIVEIATLVTDADLNIVAEGPDIVVHVDDAELDGMSEVVRNMHAKSGLTDAIRASTVTLEEAGAATLAFIKEHVPHPGMSPLCGNCIGTDRGFSCRTSRRSSTTCTTAASTCRPSRNSCRAGTRRPTTAPQQDRQSPRPRRHRRLRQ